MSLCLGLRIESLVTNARHTGENENLANYLQVVLSIALMRTIDSILCEDIDDVLKGLTHSAPGCLEILVDHARTQIGLRKPDSALLAVKSGKTEKIFHALKTTLADKSPVFAACFQHPESEEMKSNCYTMAAFSPEAVETFIIYCEYCIVPDAKKHCVELAKLAHQYRVPALLKLCELFMMEEVCALVASDCESFAAELARLLDICVVAALLELPLLLVQLHFVMMTCEQKIADLADIAQWEEFQKTSPAFALKKWQAVVNMKKAVSDKQKTLVGS